MYGIIFNNEEAIFKLEEKDRCNNSKLLSINLNIPEKELVSRLNWYYKYGIYYYYKNTATTITMLNHLIAEKIALIYKLKTPHFIPVITDYNGLGIASKNFRTKDTKYLNNLNIYRDIRDINALLSILTNNNIIIDDIMRFLVFQFYTSLEDMHEGNFLFKEENNSIYLDTLFDFDYTFQSISKTSYICKSDLLRIKIPSLEFYQLIDLMPKLKQYLLTIEDIDILKIIEDIEYENNCYIYDLIKDNYKEQDDNKKNIVRSLKL